MSVSKLWLPTSASGKSYTTVDRLRELHDGQYHGVAVYIYVCQTPVYSWTDRTYGTNCHTRHMLMHADQYLELLLYIHLMGILGCRVPGWIQYRSSTR